MKNDIEITSPELLARYFIFIERNFRSESETLTFPNTLAPGRTLYRKYRVQFDLLYSFRDKYNLNLIKYIKFFICHLKKSRNCIEDDLINLNIIKLYADYLKINEHHKTVFKWFMKSVNNIIEECISLDLPSVTEYFRYLIINNLLAEKILSGKISYYYLAGINNLEKIVKKVDSINRAELLKICEKRDILNSELQDAFLFIRSQRISPIQYTNKLLIERLNGKN